MCRQRTYVADEWLSKRERQLDAGGCMLIVAAFSRDFCADVDVGGRKARMWQLELAF